MHKHKAAALLGGVMAVSVLLGGCSYGVGDTVRLVKEAEKAKDSVSGLSNSNLENVSVGTAADPDYKASKLAVDSFTIEYDGESFYAQWDMRGADSTDLQVQIFADKDETGFDGVKIGSFRGQELDGTKDFSYAMLEPGEYYCYLKAAEGDSDPIFQYADATVVIPEETVEGTLSNVQISMDGAAILFSWDPEETAEKYKAFITDDTGAILGESVVVGSQAKIDFPGNVDTVFAAVADFTDDQLGPYELVKLRNSVEQ